MTSNPTPQPAHDHGSAGFCTDHAQVPAERTETVARVLRDRVNLDAGRYEGCEARLDEVILASHTINERVLRIEGSPEVIAAAVVAALDDESARLRASADAWWTEYDRELTAHEATKAEVERLTRIVNGYDRTPAEQRAADAEAERDSLRAECRDTWRMFEAAKAQRDEARKAGAGFWPALAGQNDRDAWTFMAERDAARAALDRVRALCGEAEAVATVHVTPRNVDHRPCETFARSRFAARIRAALDPEEPR